MTTKIIVDAHAGWPVRVTRYEKQPDGQYVKGSSSIVLPGSAAEFVVFDGLDLRIHEMLPADIIENS